MSLTKRWLERISVDLGYEGEVNSEVLKRAQELMEADELLEGHEETHQDTDDGA
jgi:hypothetical protein